MKSHLGNSLELQIAEKLFIRFTQVELEWAAEEINITVSSENSGAAALRNTQEKCMTLLCFDILLFRKIKSWRE